MLLDLTEAVPGLTLVFVETKRGADQLEDFCASKVNRRHPFTVTARNKREAALKSFRAGRTQSWLPRMSRREAWTFLTSARREL